MNNNLEAASVLEEHADKIARLACAHLFAEQKDLEGRFGEKAQQVWTDHLNQRILELSAALAADDSKMFSSNLAWSRTAMRSRSLTPEDLKMSLVSLRSGILESLDGQNREAALTCLDQAVSEISSEKSSFDSALDPRFTHDKLALQYVQTVVAGNIIPGMQLVLDAVAHGLLVRDAYLRVLLPAQQEVGRLWHVNELSVSEEHVVSHTTQRLMAILATRVPRKTDNGYTAIAGSVAGNIHDLGIRAISYLMEFEGWRVIYLGSDIPRAEMPNTVDTFEADLVLLSIALTTQIPALQRAITEIREHGSHPTKIMVGGNGFLHNPGLWKKLGADGYASNADDALRTAKKLADSVSA